VAEIRVNTTGGLKLYDADNSHYAQIVAGTITSNVNAITLGHNLATFNAAITAGGILKTDDTTEATSTTDGSLQTDGGLSVAKDAIIGDDLKLLSDSAVLSLGAGSDATFTHDGTTGLTIAATPISIDATGELHLNSTTGDIKLQDGGTDQIAFDLDGTAGEVIMKPAVDSDDLVISQYDGTEVIRIEDNASLGLVGNKLSIANSSSDVVIKPLTDAKDIIFQQYDGTVVATVEDNATFNIPASKLAIGGTAVTSTAAELNLLDGGTSVGSSITLADADGFVVNDGGTMKTIPASDINTYASGNLVKISSGTWNASTDTLSLSNVFTTTYKHYVFYLTNVIPSANAGVNMQLETGGSGSYVTSSSYHYVLIGRDSSGNLTNTQDNNSSNIEFQAQAILGGHGSKRGNYIVDFFDPMNGDCYTTVNTQATYHDADGATEFNKGAGAYLANTAVTGFRVLLSSGNIDTYAANYALYGLKA
jgi:hypothetical protein